MKRMIGLFITAMLVSGALFAQQPDSTAYTSPQEQKPNEKPKSSSAFAERFYYGGSIGFSFGNYFRIGVSPMVGFRYSRNWSLGVRVGYEYIRDERYSETITSSNYGFSVFDRWRPIPQLYLHIESAYYSYKLQTETFGSEREWVPFVFVGAGYVQRISPRVSAFVEVLFDVYRDDHSPYEDWEPMISVGVWAGL